MKNSRKLHPWNFARILWRRRWYALAVFVLVGGAVCAYALRLPDIYLSTAMLQGGPAFMPKDYVRPSDGSAPEEQIDTVRLMIQSRSLIERLIQEFRLYGYGTSNEFVMDDAVRSVRNNIQVEIISRNTFTVSYTSTDPKLAQSFTRRLVEMLIQSNNSMRKSRLIEADQFLDEQLRQSERDLAAKEEQIKQFKTSNQTPYTPAQEQALMALSRDHGILSNQYTTLHNMKFQAQLTANL